MKKIIGLVIALLIIGGGVWYYLSTAKASAGTYVTEAVRVGDITSSVSATGRLQPKVSVLVGTEVSGTIRQIMMDYNSVVKKGQVLVKLDQEVIGRQVEQARANLMNAQAKLDEVTSGKGMQASSVKTSIDQKKATLAKDEAAYNRSEKLLARGIISQQDLDASKEQYIVSKSLYEQSLSETGKNDVTNAQIEEARAVVKQSRAALMLTETNLEKTVIHSPMDGIVIDKTVEVGQTVAASFNTPTLLTIGDLGTMQVQVSIDEADVGAVKVGQDASFTVDAFPSRQFNAKVVQVYYAPITVQNVVTYTGIIEIANPEGLLRPGMTANVQIITAEKKDVLIIPNSALRVKIARDKTKKGDKSVNGDNADKPDGADKSAKSDNPDKSAGTDGADGGEGDKPRKSRREGYKTVYIMKDKKPVRTRVKTGIMDFTYTEVTEGLSEGDMVVTDSADKSADKSNKSGSGGSHGGGGGGGGMRGFH